MGLKASYYNYITPYKETSFLFFNCMTGALGLFTQEQRTAYMSYLEGNQPLDAELQNILVYGGFLIPETLDEKVLLRERMKKTRYNSSTLALTIAPTLKCNFACPYCFEAQGELAGPMSVDVQQYLIDFIRRKAREIRHLKVQWYGGEPLMAMDVVENLNEHIARIVEENKLEYSAQLITNGYLLTPEIAQKMKDWNVKGIQITLDGPPETHDRRRIPPDGAPTFYQILKNIKAAAGSQIPFVIRVNVDQDNIDQCERVLDIIEQEGLKEQAYLNFSPVRSFNADAVLNNCVADKDFASFHTILRSNLLARGFKATKTICPVPLGNGCSADLLNAYLIDPAGWMYKCWTDIGYPDLAVGHLGWEINTPDYYKLQQQEWAYMNYDPLEDEKCGKCKLMPICFGGCQKSRKINDSDCYKWKYQLDDIIKDIVKYRLYESMNQDRHF